MNQRLVSVALISFGTLSLYGCQNHSDHSAPTSRTSDLKKEYRFTNGTVDVVIVPAIGRAMRYGYVGGPNLLYTAPEPSIPPAGYVNWGGDKAWIWPQSDWEKLIGHKWPPPESLDGSPWEIRVISGLSCILTSPVIPPWGARIERQMDIAPAGTSVRWTNRLIKVDGTSCPPAAVWQVTQLQPVDQIDAHLTTPARQPPYALLLTTPFESIAQHDDRLELHRNRHESAKIGIEADRLSAVIGGTRVTVEHSFAPATPGYRANERAQVYTAPDAAEPAPNIPNPAYVEMEFTSPLTDFTAEREASMTVKWELSPATPR